MGSAGRKDAWGGERGREENGGRLARERGKEESEGRRKGRRAREDEGTRCERWAVTRNGRMYLLTVSLPWRMPDEADAFDHSCLFALARMYAPT